MTRPHRSIAPLGLAPSKIVGLLGNDSARADNESGEVDFFLKAPSSLVGPDGAIRIPPDDDVRLVPECELGVVIGTGGTGIAIVDAIDHVEGYTIALDLTVRGPKERSRRKSHDTFCPVGPRIVTAADFGDPGGRSLRLWVGGELIQDWSTDYMMLGVPDAISWISSIMTLEAGDLILMGAPRMTSQLSAGDTLSAEIDGIGTLEIPVTS